MFTRTKFTTAIILASTLSLSVATAHEVSLKDMTTLLVDNAVQKTALEIENNIYSEILTASHHFSLEEQDIKTRVLISDIKTEEKNDKVAE